MSKEINELAKDIYSMIRSDAMSRALASMLYGEGWRKSAGRFSAGRLTKKVDGHVMHKECPEDCFGDRCGSCHYNTELLNKLYDLENKPDGRK